MSGPFKQHNLKSNRMDRRKIYPGAKVERDAFQLVPKPDGVHRDALGLI